MNDVPSLNAYIESNPIARLLTSHLPIVGSFQTSNNRAYWLYVGLTFRPVRFVDVILQVATAASGGQTAEIAIAATTMPPNGDAQTLTKLAATGSLSSLAATGVARTSSPFNYDAASGLNVWLGFRSAMGGDEPTLLSVGRDMDGGTVLRTDAAGALTGSGPWTGALVDAEELDQAPLMRLELGVIP